MKASAIVADGTFSCMTAPLQGDYEKIFHEAAEIGYDAVQLTLNRPEEVDAERIFALAEKNRLKISAIATGMGYTVDGLSLGHGDEKIRAAAVKRMCDHVDLSEKLGGAMVIIGAIRGRYADAPSEVIYYQQFHKSMEELIPYAEKKRIVIIFEANDHLETDAYISIKDTAEYIRECGSPCFRLQLDTMHMLYEHEECYQQVLDCADILAQVDISGRDRTCPEDGEFPYDQVLKALKESGFSGYLAFEYRSVPPRAREGLAYIREKLDSIL